MSNANVAKLSTVGPTLWGHKCVQTFIGKMKVNTLTVLRPQLNKLEKVAIREALPLDAAPSPASRF